MSEAVIRAATIIKDRIWSWTVIPLAVVVVLVSMAYGHGGFVEALGGSELEGLNSVYAVACVVFGGYAVYLVAQRFSQPERSLILLAIIQTLVSVGPVMGFALPRYIVTQRSRNALIASLIYGVSLVVVFARDLVGQTQGSSVLRLFLADKVGDDVPVSVTPSAVITFYLFTLFVPIGIGYIKKSRATIEVKDEQLVEKQLVTETMGVELSRKEEREMIAREVHDNLGHRLSVLNLYAGNLELAADDDEAREYVSQVRKSAQEAVNDLHDLVEIMRDPQAAMTLSEQTNYTLNDLGDVIDNVLGGGHPVTSSILIDSPSEAPAVLTNATYRIIQELLTNAMKHAPEQAVRVRVNGGPTSGLTITVANNVDRSRGGADEKAMPDGDRIGGLTGLKERAEALGGWVQVSRERGEFLVRAWIPWDQKDGR